MPTLGIIGGIGPESTIDYYRSLVEEYRARRPDGTYPCIVIDSIDLKRLVDLITANELAQTAEFLLGELHRLARAGADFALLSANTPHVVFDELRARSPLPLISIVEATCDAAKARGFTRIGLFGTRFTMRGRFYPEVFSRQGLELVVPTPEEQEYIHERYMNELLKGVFLPETSRGLVAIAQRLKERDGIEALILGGTELPLILRDVSVPGVPFLDTTAIHVAAAVSRLVS